MLKEQGGTGGGVMSVAERRAAGLPDVEYDYERVIAEDGTEFVITHQKPESDEGIFHSDTGQVEHPEHENS